MHVTNDYLLLSQRFAAVRRSWKRNAALAGLAVVVTEGIGLFTALLFLDWLYQPQPAVRVALWAAALVALGWLAVRQVVRPLSRKISDEQIALYIEEHRAGLEGVLITAAEFGRKRETVAPGQGALIDAVIHQARERAAKMQVGGLADFSRLKKYGLAALAGIGLYAVLAVLFPATLGHHFGRVLAPWNATEEDRARHAAAVAGAEPLRFTLSRGDTSLQRGSSFDFEVTLSKARPAGQQVALNFRPRTGGAWQTLPLTEIEKLNGFQGILPDVSEDLDFYVSCGADQSQAYHLTVYDPLVVQSLETVVHLPGYLKQPDEITKPSTGDVTAVVDSTVTLRIVTSTPLREGQIKWNDGTTTAMTVDPQAKAVATVSFPVQHDATYDFAVTDVNGQKAVSPASMAVHAVPDNPPTVTITSPQSPVLTNMLGEINFDAGAGDDFGVVGLDLVYSRLDAENKPQETRLPLKTVAAASKDVPNAVEAVYRLMLEDLKPPLHPGEAISYHLEARDAKGQKALSPLGFIVIGDFEAWATYTPPESVTGVHDDTGADLMAMVAMIWDVNNARGQGPVDDWKKQVDKVAANMVDEGGNMRSFVDVDEMPQLARVAPLIAAHAKSAHDALAAYDTATATAEISIAGALFAGGGLKHDSAVHLEPNETVVGSHFHSPQMTMLEQARLSALAAAAGDKTQQEGAEQAQANAETAAEVADLLKKQDALVARAQAQSAGSQPGAGQTPPSKPNPSASPAGGQTPAAGAPSPASADDLAKMQHDLAGQTRKAAEAAAGGRATGNSTLQKAADKAAEAARLMEEASRAFGGGNSATGQQKAVEARTALDAAGKTLENNDRDKLAAEIGAAETHASVVLEKLNGLNAQTSALAKDLGSNQPDQRQKRDLEKQAYEQTQLGAQVEALNNEVGALNDRAQQVGQPEAMRAIGDAEHVVKRSQPQAKMAGAAIDLNNANPASADAGQKNAAGALQKIIDNLNAGSDGLAASREAQLHRAGRVAQEARTGLDTLNGKEPATPGQQPAAGQGNDNANGAPAAMGAGAREDIVRQLAYNVTRLAAVTDNRELVPQDQVDQLKQMGMDKTELEKRLATDPKFLQDMTQLVGAIGDKIEAELAAKTQAGKLYSLQREECPPGYRQFVNQYFEVLSHAGPAAGAAPAPAPAQP